MSEPFDKVYRSLLLKCSRLVLPVINRIFGESYDGTEAIVLEQNERIVRDSDGTINKKDY